MKHQELELPQASEGTIWDFSNPVKPVQKHCRKWNSGVLELFVCFSSAKTILTPSSCGAQAWIQEPGWRAGSGRCSGPQSAAGMCTAAGRRRVWVRQWGWWCNTRRGAVEAGAQGCVWRMAPSSLPSPNLPGTLGASKTQHLRHNEKRFAH